MQLLRTECSIAIDSGAGAAHLVKFIGEGGEAIEVRLAGPQDEAINDAQLVAKAAATMVQLARFLVDDMRSEASAGPDFSSGAGLVIDSHPTDQPVPLDSGPSRPHDHDPTQEPPVA